MMPHKTTCYIVQNIKTGLDNSGEEEIFAKARTRLHRVFSARNISALHLYKQSVDARKKDGICFVSSVLAEIDGEKPKTEIIAAENIVPAPDAGLHPVFGETVLNHRPVVVGFGPCGMFAALILARNGYCPLVLERGKSVYERTDDVKRFYETGLLDPTSNIQFGAGGAGTFSDGKLITRINDPLGTFVLEEMVKAGAPKDILFCARPHIGTDYLKKVVSAIEKEIVSLGGEIRYLSKVCGFESRKDTVCSLKTDDGDVPCGTVLLAIGHSARDTFDMLSEKKVLLTPKPFSVGVRIEHLQETIDRALYGTYAGDPRLPKGEYNLSAHNGDRGVYTFCMCPGGEVMAAASEEGGIVTNGMSRYARDKKNANCAVAVSVFPEDYGRSVQGAIAFQRKIERCAYALTSSYRAPCETVGHFLGNTTQNEPTTVFPSYMNGNVAMTDMKRIFPSFITESLAFGLKDFGRKMKGFDFDDAILTGPETRTSSPVRIPRSDCFTASGYDNFYVGGEGAGYAGGITSAAIDGIRLALAVMAKYKPLL